ncbi:hypothetical protein CDL15_Pgr019891 [Punica granatum]|uniref:Uncharacterized protein n=1 Tax=Punica granatum TaxID=22663 RepID=A0A218W5C3_PUNGR|nr:hypothetical protein CDL15_Pgr019891 [Punica granatum]
MKLLDLQMKMQERVDLQSRTLRELDIGGNTDPDKVGRALGEVEDGRILAVGLDDDDEDVIGELGRGGNFDPGKVCRTPVEEEDGIMAVGLLAIGGSVDLERVGRALGDEEDGSTVAVGLDDDEGGSADPDSAGRAPGEEIDGSIVVVGLGDKDCCLEGEGDDDIGGSGLFIDEGKAGPMDGDTVGAGEDDVSNRRRDSSI